MNPKKISWFNSNFGAGQEEYRQLPAYRDAEGTVTTCWELSFAERLKLLFTGRLWLHILTFNQPLQPVLPTVDGPKDPTDGL